VQRSISQVALLVRDYDEAASSPIWYAPGN
jgi:hypothetical protein